LVFIRTLSLKWRLDEHQLEDTAVMERCAGDVLARVRGDYPVRIPVSAADAAGDLVVFDDEAHWRAAHLLASATLSHAQAWFFKPLEAEGDPLRALTRPAGHALARQVLQRLAMPGRLVEVMAKARRETAVELATQLLPDTVSAPAAATVAAPTLAPPPPLAALAVVARSLPRDLPSPVAALVLHAHARTLPGFPREAVESAVQQCLVKFREGSAKQFPIDADSRHVATTNALGPESPRAVDVPSHEVTGREPFLKTKRDEAEPYGPITDNAIVPTRLGGLFYLLNCALELNLGESLWKACLPEQKILGHAAAALVGEELMSDAGISLFAGSGPGPPVPSVSEDQLNEVSEALLVALCAALPRRGLAQLPQTMLSLEYQGRASLLAARPVSSPFAIFARPAPTPDAARTALEAFLAHWTRSAPAPLVSPGLAELDASGRLRPTHQAEKPPAALLPKAPSAPATALLAQTIGVLCCLLQARAGATDIPNANSFVEKYIQLPARVLDSTEELTVVMPADAVKIELRRAGLDRNPGWVPWLQKTVRLEFADDRANANQFFST
jgi:hypothetical protein